MKLAIVLLALFASQALGRELLQCTSTAIAGASAEAQSSVATAVSNAFADCSGESLGCHVSSRIALDPHVRVSQSKGRQLPYTSHLTHALPFLLPTPLG